MSARKYIVDLAEDEREVCQDVVKKLKGTSQKVRRATVLLKADRGWTDAKIADALDCRTTTVEKFVSGLSNVASNKRSTGSSVRNRLSKEF